MISQLKNIYVDYDKMVLQITDSTSVLARAFNFGLNARNHPCHQEFYDTVGAWVHAFLETAPAPETVYEAAEHIITASTRYENEDSCAYMLAAQAHAMELIPLLSSERRAQLRDWFDARYPKKVRLPVQDKLYKLLRK